MKRGDNSGASSRFFFADKVSMVKGMGFMGNNYGGDDRIVMVVPADTAAAAAEKLTTPATGHNVH